MKKPRVPKGYRLVTRGRVHEDDLFWSTDDNGWWLAEPLEFPRPVERISTPIARKVPRPRKGKGKKGRK